MHGLSERRPVALNSIRADMADTADTPEESDYTSIKQRIIAAGSGEIPEKLCRFQGVEIKHQAPGIPCSEKDYIELVDATGRILRNDKRGAIDASLSPILQRLEIDTETWLDIATTFEDACVRGRLGLGRLRRNAQTRVQTHQEEMDLQNKRQPEALPAKSLQSLEPRIMHGSKFP